MPMPEDIFNRLKYGCSDTPPEFSGYVPDRPCAFYIDDKVNVSSIDFASGRQYEIKTYGVRNPMRVERVRPTGSNLPIWVLKLKNCQYWFTEDNLALAERK